MRFDLPRFRSQNLKMSKFSLSLSFLDLFLLDNGQIKGCFCWYFVYFVIFYFSLQLSFMPYDWCQCCLFSFSSFFFLAAQQFTYSRSFLFKFSTICPWSSIWVCSKITLLIELRTQENKDWYSRYFTWWFWEVSQNTGR